MTTCLLPACLQENAGDMSLRLPFLRLLVQHLNCSVFAPSYRGYGLSQGSPNEAGLKLDAQAALDWLQASKDVNQGQVLSSYPACACDSI